MDSEEESNYSHIGCSNPLLPLLLGQIRQQFDLKCSSYCFCTITTKPTATNPTTTNYLKSSYPRTAKNVICTTQAVHSMFSMNTWRFHKFILLPVLPAVTHAVIDFRQRGVMPVMSHMPPMSPTALHQVAPLPRLPSLRLNCLCSRRAAILCAEFAQQNRRQRSSRMAGRHHLTTDAILAHVIKGHQGIKAYREIES